MITWLADKLADGDRKAILALFTIAAIIFGLIFFEWGLNSVLFSEPECHIACGSDAEFHATATAIAGELGQEIDLNDVIEDR